VISREYRALLRQKHREQRWGEGGHLWAPYLTYRLRELNLPFQILDYGCGRGTLKDALPSSADVREYDPGIPGKDAAPAPANAVICTDVLEHVEADQLDGVLAHLAQLVRSYGLFVICCRPAKEKLPDGRNAHLIVQPPFWWMEQLCRFFEYVELRSFTLKEAVFEVRCERLHSVAAE
jgi:hypothetical protein